MESSLLGLVHDEYLRQRLAPRPGDSHYLTLSDLLLGLEEILKKAKISKAKVLDFGCGGSPYRALFQDASGYRKADLAGIPYLDYEMHPQTAAIQETDSQFDVLFSSQVLEHVESPQKYLQEARRLLKPQGSLILSTHGTFQDHPCPSDYWRWTGQGLRREMENAGFQIQDILYLTTGPRAALAIAEMNFPALGRGRAWTKKLFTALEAVWRTLRGQKLAHKMADRLGGRYRVVRQLPPFQGVYLALLVLAVPLKK